MSLICCYKNIKSVSMCAICQESAAFDGGRRREGGANEEGRERSVRSYLSTCSFSSARVGVCPGITIGITIIIIRDRDTNHEESLGITSNHHRNHYMNH